MTSWFEDHLLLEALITTYNRVLDIHFFMDAIIVSAKLDPEAINHTVQPWGSKKTGGAMAAAWQIGNHLALFGAVRSR